MDGHDPAAWWHPDDDYHSEDAAAGDNFADMLDNYSTDDLFELVWQGGGEGGSVGQPAVSCLRSSEPATPPPSLSSKHVPLDPPPSEDVMAAWLSIASGEGHTGDGLKVPAAKEPSTVIGSFGTTTSESKGKLLMKEGVSGMDTNATSQSNERRKTSGGSSRTRSSHHSGTHNITEKRRRCKITDRLRTLQQLVPGCDKSNQASTLEQTIQYMKSLQQHVQSMSVGCSMRPPPAAAAAAPAVCSIVPQPYMQPSAAMAPEGGGYVVRAAAAGMVPYGAMLPYQPHYHAVKMPAAAPLFWPAPAPAASAAPTAAPAAAAGSHGQCSVAMEEKKQQHKKERKG